MKTLDDIRAKYPHLGTAVYALTPGGIVTLECVSSDGKLFSFTGQTEAEAVALAFPDEEETPQSERVLLAPAVPLRTEAATPKGAGSPAPTPTSVFD